MFNDFFKWMVVLTAGAWVVLAIPLYAWGYPAIVWGALIGCILPAISFIVGVYAVYRSFHLPMPKFMMVFMGGMLARMFFIGIVVFLIVSLTQLHQASLVASLLGFYILYLVLEVYFVNSRLQHAKEPQS